MIFRCDPSESNLHIIIDLLGCSHRLMYGLIWRRFYFKSGSLFPNICIRCSSVTSFWRASPNIGSLRWFGQSQTVQVLLGECVCVCVRLVLLAPGSPAQAKLPVRSWHHLPPSQPYTEDNRALLWGSCDLSVQLVCPYFCHPVRIQLLSLSFPISFSLSSFLLSLFLSVVNASLWCWLWLQLVDA